VKAILNRTNVNIKKYFVFFILLFCVITPPVLAQAPDSVYFFDKEIIVTASRIPTAFLKISRNVTVLDQQAIRSIPVSNIADLLDYAAGVDVRQRGANGIQADVSLRGATFEQTLVMIDGVKLIDPQTGHHNLDLPISLHDIEKIEILKGPGSRLFGPNAFGGVINIITKSPQPNSIFISQNLGSYDLFESAAAMNRFNNRLSFYHGQASGYQKNTDFRICRGFYKSQLNLKFFNADISAGFVDKKFGANSYYSPDFPLQWEHTATGFLNFTSKTRFLSHKLTSRVHWRHHNDDFLLDRKNPDFYSNHHVTDVLGAEFQTVHVSLLGMTSFGTELNLETIRSNNLGNHRRNSQGIFIEHQIFLENFNFDFGGSGYHYSGWGWRFWPGIDASYQLSKSSKIYGSLGRAFRIPTYTDLFYSSPENIGNPNLQEESCWNYESGYRFHKKNFLLSLTIFQRKSKNLIDWTWQEAKKIWEAQNVNSLNTTGFEFSLQWQPAQIISTPIQNLAVTYSYLTSNKRSSRVSKYAINHLRHNLSAKITILSFKNSVKISPIIRYQDRYHFGHVWLSDLRILIQKSSWQFFLEGNNVFNQRYRDTDFVLLPGRWLKAGIQFQK